MIVPFERASYRSQIHRLRRIGNEAIRRYPIQVESMNFINHGENTTFRVKARFGKTYLLRIHRSGYHSQEALHEEIDWLVALHDADESLCVPLPIRSKGGRWIESVSLQTTEAICGERNCSLLSWVDGRFADKAISLKMIFDLGEATAKLHAFAPAKVNFRRYWDANGLLSSEAKFGSVDRLVGVTASDQRLITEGRKLILAKLKGYARRFPRRSGLIHADLHFGNLLFSRRGVGVIDFDDCGFGFHAYDIAVSLTACEHILGRLGQRDDFAKFRDALTSGYRKHGNWDRHDDVVLNYLMSARKILMLGWLNSRSDNPKLRPHLQSAVMRTIEHLQKTYRI